MDNTTVIVVIALCVVGWHVYLGFVIWALNRKVQQHVKAGHTEAHLCYEPDSAA